MGDKQNVTRYIRELEKYLKTKRRIKQVRVSVDTSASGALDYNQTDRRHCIADASKEFRLRNTNFGSSNKHLEILNY